MDGASDPLDLGNLRRDLAAFSAFDDRLVEARAAMLTLATSAGALSRDHYSPGHFTASAFVLDPSGTELLLIHHRKLDLWLQPGGHVEPEDRNLLAAARREVREETGVVEGEVLEAIFDLDVHEIPPLPGAPGHRHFDVRCLLRARTSEVRPSVEVREARWFPLAVLAEGAGPLSALAGTDESVRRAARRLLAGR